MSWHPVNDARPRYRGEASGLAWPTRIEDFRVEEIPLYLPSGEGEHLYLEIEKRGISTSELVQRLAAGLGLDSREIGWAGRKDRHAVTRQRLSLPRRAEAGLSGLSDPDYRILEARLHRNKLKPGHLAGNRFELFLAGRVEPSFLDPLLTELREKGLPNYFGPQRFGARGNNHEVGLKILASGRRPRGRREKLMANAWQSCLFNRVLDARIDQLDRLLVGDLAWIHAKGAVFEVADPAAEADRLGLLEISASGPLPGRKMSRPSGEPGRLEERMLEECGWDQSQGEHLRGVRRPLRVPVAALEGDIGEDGVRLRFSLPPGSYATALLRELGLALR